MSIANKGLEGIVAAETRMSYIDGEKGILEYVGIAIDDLARNSSFEETVFLLWNTRLPTTSELAAFTADLRSRYELPKGMLERITSGADKVIFTKVDNIRTADPNELAAQYTELYGKMAQVAPSLEDALAIANRAVTKEDLICITGSFYLVGEAKKYFTAKQAAAALAQQTA